MAQRMSNKRSHRRSGALTGAQPLRPEPTDATAAHHGTRRAEIRPTTRSVRRPALPSGRAALGAFLVIVSAAGVLVALSKSGEGAPSQVVASRRAFLPGESVIADDLILVPARLEGDLATRVFRDPKSLDGATVIGPLAAGELLQSSNVIRKVGGARSREISLAIDAARAAGGHLAPHDRVDVIATFGAGQSAQTHVVASNLIVVRADRNDAAIGTSRGSMTITLGLDDPALEVALAHASHVAQISLVRTTGAVGSPPPGVYVPAQGRA